MSYVLTETTGRTAIVRMNRPETYNALNKELIVELAAVFEKLDTDQDVDYVLFKAEGKGFCAGLDLHWANAIEAKEVKNLVTNYFNRLTKAIFYCRKPVICVLHGAASGAGSSLVLACDMVVATEQATLAFPFVNLGLQPDTGMSYYLTQRVGYHQAFEWLLEGKTLSAKEAQEHKLVQQVFPDADSLRIYTEKLLQHFSQLQPGAGASLKLLLTSGSQDEYGYVLNEEAEQQYLAVKGGMLKKKIAEFFAKKK